MGGGGGCTVSVWPITFDPGRETKTGQHNIEGPHLAVITVVHPAQLLYHPPAPANEVEDRLVWRILNVSTPGTSTSSSAGICFSTISGIGEIDLISMDHPE